MIRFQLPVHSPVTAGAVAAGAWAAVSGNPRRADRRIRDALQTRFNTQSLLLTNSGTSALTLALKAVEHAGRQPVALPAYCCFDLATAADGAQCDVLYYDVDPVSLAPDPQSLETVLKAGAGSVVLAHLYGVPAMVASVQQVLRQYDVTVIDDAAQGVGGTVGGCPLGSLGSLGILSFGRGKGTTGGGGGALMGFGEAGNRLLEWARAQTSDGSRGLADAVKLGAQWALARPLWYAVPASLPFLGLGETVYRAPRVPGRATAASRGALAITLNFAEEESAVRRRHAERLSAILPESAGRAVSAGSGAEAGYLRFPVLASPAVRGAATTRLARRLGIAVGYPRPLSELPTRGRRVLNGEQAFDGAGHLARSLVTLPTHSRVSAADFSRLGEWLAHPH